MTRMHGKKKSQDMAKGDTPPPQPCARFSSFFFQDGRRKTRRKERRRAPSPAGFFVFPCPRARKRWEKAPWRWNRACWDRPKGGQDRAWEFWWEIPTTKGDRHWTTTTPNTKPREHSTDAQEGKLKSGIASVLPVRVANKHRRRHSSSEPLSRKGPPRKKRLASIDPIPRADQPNYTEDFQDQAKKESSIIAGWNKADR